MREEGDDKPCWRRHPIPGIHSNCFSAWSQFAHAAVCSCDTRVPAGQTITRDLPASWSNTVNERRCRSIFTRTSVIDLLIRNFAGIIENVNGISGLHSDVHRSCEYFERRKPRSFHPRIKAWSNRSRLIYSYTSSSITTFSLIICLLNNRLTHLQTSRFSKGLGWRP